MSWLVSYIGAVTAKFLSLPLLYKNTISVAHEVILAICGLGYYWLRASTSRGVSWNEPSTGVGGMNTGTVGVESKHQFKEKKWSVGGRGVHSLPSS